MSDIVNVPTSDGELPVHRWLPASGRGPGVVVLQEIFGVSDYIRQRCADLAAAGYVVYAPELYARLGELTFDPDGAEPVDVLGHPGGHCPDRPGIFGRVLVSGRCGSRRHRITSRSRG